MALSSAASSDLTLWALRPSASNLQKQHRPTCAPCSVRDRHYAHPLSTTRRPNSSEERKEQDSSPWRFPTVTKKTAGMTDAARPEARSERPLALFVRQASGSRSATQSARSPPVLASAAGAAGEICTRRYARDLAVTYDACTANSREWDWRFVAASSPPDSRSSQAHVASWWARFPSMRLFVHKLKADERAGGCIRCGRRRDESHP